MEPRLYEQTDWYCTKNCLHQETIKNDDYSLLCEECTLHKYTVTSKASIKQQL